MRRFTVVCLGAVLCSTWLSSSGSAQQHANDGNVAGPPAPPAPPVPLAPPAPPTKSAQIASPASPAPPASPASPAKNARIASPSAPAKDKTKRAIVLVMESSGGVRAASALRTALNIQPGLRVITLDDVAKKGAEPAAVVTVAAVTNQQVSVVYWDRAGRRDSLSAPAPTHADHLDAVVLALASALIERNRVSLDNPRSMHTQDSRLAPYAVLGGFAKLYRRLNVALRYEDF